MIVVLGRPEVAQAEDGAFGASGSAVGIAVEVAASGEPVELVGSIGDDPEGDAVAVALGTAGVGHAALLRDPAGRTPRRTDVGADRTASPPPRLDADDVALGLRYLPACHVLVVVDRLDGAARAAALEGAAYHGATVLAVVPSADDVSDDLRGALVLLAPGPEEDEAGDLGPTAFERFVADLAVRIARGTQPDAALAQAVAAGAWEPIDG